MQPNKVNDMFEMAAGKFKGLMDANSVVGEPIVAQDGTMIVPISKLSFGFGGGGTELEGSKDGGNTRFGGGLGGGASVQAEAFLVINESNVRLIPMNGGGGTVDKLIDMMPTAIDKVNGFISSMSEKKAAKKAKKGGAVDAAGEIYDNN